MRTMEATPGMTAAGLAIARALYASIFDYPLTLAQLRQTLIESTLTPSEIVSVYAGSEALQKTIEQREGFYFPRGRGDLIAERRRREARSRRFLNHHRLVLSLIAAMPYVRMAALSGSVAHLNLDGDGDLDLFIITKGKQVWSVTVACVIIAKLLRRRRTLCVNFVVADSALALEQQDLFTASQIIHLKPLVGQSEYRRFLAENPFVARFYPNFHYTGVERRPVRQRQIVGALKNRRNGDAAGVGAGRTGVPARVSGVLGPPIGHVAFAGAGPARTRLSQAPYPEPSAVCPRALRKRGQRTGIKRIIARGRRQRSASRARSRRWRRPTRRRS